MSAMPTSPYLVMGLVVLLAAGFISPTLIALARQVEWIWVVVIFNLIGVGWLAAMICAVTFPRRQAVTFFAEHPTSPGVPLPYHGANRRRPPRAG